jgi:UDP-glucose 4-epimerase
MVRRRASSTGEEPKCILCTGGLGFIGSHTVVQLHKAGFRVAILDNCVNSNPEVLNRLATILDIEDITTEIAFHRVDLMDKDRLDDLFAQHKFTQVVHFAGLKSVGESVSTPLFYYSNNLTGTLNLLEAMSKHNCKQLVFSSSATVYKPFDGPVHEECPLGPSNPYGHTKLMTEQFLRDLANSDAEWRISMLRYFNPVGAHESGLIGENPLGPPNNLMPYIQQVGVGRRESLTIFGDDYDTPDGTGVRDYLHVEDLAAGHLAALSFLNKQSDGCCTAHNLGTGKGFSVLEMVKAFEKHSGREIPYKIGTRRPGDLACVVADAAKAEKELGWKATRTIDDVMRSAWKWQSKNPRGYDGTTQATPPIASTLIASELSE